MLGFGALGQLALGQQTPSLSVTVPAGGGGRRRVFGPQEPVVVGDTARRPPRRWRERRVPLPAAAPPPSDWVVPEFPPVGLFAAPQPTPPPVDLSKIRLAPMRAPQTAPADDLEQIMGLLAMTPDPEVDAATQWLARYTEGQNGEGTEET
jgi:hypothetical protein